MLPQPFQPVNATQSLTAGATAQQFVLSAWQSPEGGAVLIVNRGTFDVFVQPGDATVVATGTGNICVLSKTSLMLTLKGTMTAVSVIAPDGNTQVLLTQGRFGG